jgi:hypothetical protein
MLPLNAYSLYFQDSETVGVKPPSLGNLYRMSIERVAGNLRVEGA